ncbi:hypothetical protein OS493_037336 [Desmophyllum pertusum]|uniref:Uncharacterized protein n=1 Tax=Desmophyllum pertusum TaxID=174260 RepID=A0A9W9YX43_9CNID|nr:hypothetical protein OS493_037336 [Desmophyllum pertusum]
MWQIRRIQKLRHYKVKGSQSTAIEKNDHVASKCSRGNQNQSPAPVNVTNDGTNACAFLSVKIADRVINNFDGNASDTTTLAEMIEEVIWFLPEEINAKRNLATFYDVLETYALLSKEKLLNSKYDFFEELPFGDCIYSFEVREQLHEKLCVLGQNDFSAIFSSVPYILVIGCAAGRAFVIDTHTGSLIVGRNNAPLTWKSLCIWLWDRLLCAGVKEEISNHPCVERNQNSPVTVLSDTEDERHNNSKKRSSESRDINDEPGCKKQKAQPCGSPDSYITVDNSKKGASESRDGPGWKEQAANAQPRGSKGDSESNVGPSTSRVNASVADNGTEQSTDRSPASDTIEEINATKV